jgi:hypothetical protein
LVDNKSHSPRILNWSILFLSNTGVYYRIPKKGAKLIFHELVGHNTVLSVIS